MNKILSFFKSKWFIGITGFLAVAALIWYIGPLIAVAGQSPLSSDLGRVFTIMTVGGAYGLTQLIYYINTLRTNRNMLADLAGQASGQAGALGGGASGSEQGAAREEQIRDQQRKKEEEAASAEEISTLKQGLDEALATLKKSRLSGKSGHSQYLYQLPWYIIIGPPGSGKTTALINSGLRFPLGAGKVRGVGGTRNCDWWFTDEAVMLDTAGRYTTQDSHEEVDRAAWRGFLDLLKKHRRRRPINGAFIAISLSDLIQQSEDERAAQALAIKQRIQELHEHFGIRFPIYVLFTKTDLIAGFIEFFNDLGQEERAQVWGMTLPMDDPSDPEGVVEHFAAEFELLEKRLNDRLVNRLQDERDPQRRDLIYTFPQQFGSLRQVAERFLKEVFRPSRYEERVLLRGVYFTSGTQEGTPIDRLMSSLASTFGLNRQTLSTFSGKGRSYFITRLLRDVIFPEAEIAGANLRVERWRAWIQRGAYAAALLITITAAVLWLTSYARNEMYVQAVEKQRLEVEKQITALSPDQTDPAAALSLLNAARAIPGGYDDRNAGVPWLMGFGLYQGYKLGGEAILIYERLLIQAFLPRIVLLMENRLRQNVSDPGYLYNTLAVYLMMDDPERFNAKAIKDWMEQDWQSHLPRNFTREQREQLLAHLDALLAQAPLESPIALDSVLIQNTRGLLNQVPLSQRIYERLKSQRGSEVPPEIGLTVAAGPDTPRVFNRKSGQPLNTGVPGLYTYQGYYRFFLKASPKLVGQLAEESWILGSSVQISTNLVDQQRIADEVCRLYLGDFFEQWQNLLADVQIKPFNNLDTALDIMQVLSAPASPLRTLIETVARETALSQPPASPQDANKVAAESSLTDRIAGVLGDSGKTGVTPTIQPCAIDSRLSGFNIQYVNEIKGEEGAIPPLDKTLSTLENLYSQMNAIARAQEGSSDGKIPQNLKDQFGVVVNQVQVDAARKPPPFNVLLNKLAQDSTDVVRSVRDQLNSQWQAAKIAAFFQDNLKGRYPLARSSIQWSGGAPALNAPVPANTIQWVNPDAGAGLSRTVQGPPDATLSAFIRFFGPNGLMDTFFQKSLKPYVDTSQGSWVWRGPAGPEQSISPEALQAFQRAAAVRAALFPGNSSNPSVPFQLVPMETSRDISQVIIEVEGQTLIYNAGQPAQVTNLRWTGASGKARVEFLPAGGGLSKLDETGPWAWFKILDQTQEQSTGTGQFRIAFQLGGRQAIYELRSSSGSNPFRLRELEGFRCPDQL
ncbi:MAG TPA: type VI secretion system membrane subunit TssM [Candidatus Competibacteraceae bacterium]|nr:type VI secretion system membrane subunit TssM [Candidatus Competibacteraceae bacterium]HPF57524.1 type VI secretion system membrane subunit TssM [Candidatus Competibacteraceae bacterium]HRY16955.1 type VI secretion system membrane subunit TssM [Candidatus Competibacteraceae bacterium]